MKDFKLPKSEDEQTVLKTIRMKFATLKKIEDVAKESNLSINRVINECIEFALDNLDNKPFQNKK